MPIHIERHQGPDGPRVTVSGDVDLTTGERLELELLSAEAEAPPVLTLDLSAVDFFDSTGLQLLLDADVRAHADGRRLVVAPGDGEVARVLALTQVADRLNVAVVE
jgi:anti-anti-sigma factor